MPLSGSGIHAALPIHRKLLPDCHLLIWIYVAWFKKLPLMLKPVPAEPFLLQPPPSATAYSQQYYNNSKFFLDFTVSNHYSFSPYRSLFITRIAKKRLKTVLFTVNRWDGLETPCYSVCQYFLLFPKKHPLEFGGNALFKKIIAVF